MAARIDPLLAAVIAKLPAAGGEFPRENRVNWLKTMSMALGMAYGEVGAIAIDPAAPAQARDEQGAPIPMTPSPPPPRPGPRYSFFIDQEGKARRMNGDRINANQLNGEVLYDFRGEAGDLRAITWADDSRGVPGGLQIDISAVEAP